MKGFNQKGVTIVEVMIVLAIIALVFAITFGVFEGYLNKESFRQSVNLFTNDINDVLNDVRTGSFPNIEGVICKNDAGSIEFEVDPTNPQAKPGNRDDCHLLGKAIQLGTEDTVSELADNYIEHTLISLNEKGGTSVKFEKLKFQVFRSDLAVLETNSQFFNTSKSKVIPHGGQIKKVYYDKNTDGDDDPRTIPNNVVYIDGFAVVVSEFGERNDGDTSDFLGGSRNIALRVIHTDTGADQIDASRGRVSEADFVSNTENHNPGPTTPPPVSLYYHKISYPIVICLESGTEEMAVIRIGSASGTLEALPDLDPSRAMAACDF